MASVKFGWRVPDFPTDGSAGTQFFEQIHSTLEVVSEHFATAWVADHFVPWASWQSVDTDTIECLTTVAYLAAAYPKLTWGTIVLCQSYRNPALLAKMVANICAFAPGRFVFGIGAGWKEDEYRAYGYPFPRAAVRIQQLDETCEIVKRMWTQQPATFEGQYYQIRDAHLSPKPNPLPPIMVGGGGERRTLRVVAKHADWCNPGGSTPAAFRHKLDVLREHCAAVGTDYDRIVKTWSCECVAVAPTDAEARRRAEASPFYSPDSALFGTPDKVASQLQEWVDAGVTHFLLRFADFPRRDSIKLFGEEVIPRFS